MIFSETLKTAFISDITSGQNFFKNKFLVNYGFTEFRK